MDPEERRRRQPSLDRVQPLAVAVALLPSRPDQAIVCLGLDVENLILLQQGYAPGFALDRKSELEDSSPTFSTRGLTSMNEILPKEAQSPRSAAGALRSNLGLLQ